jgi:predicted Zn-dependent protease
MIRRSWFLFPLLALGLSARLGAEPAARPPLPPALNAWQLGQYALERDQADKAVDYFRLSLRLDPSLAASRLGLASAYIALGQDEKAAPHLARYVAERPDHHLVRAQFAEVLLRLYRPQEARAQLERFCAAVQEDLRLARDHLPHSHMRLMEIAEADGDDYAAHLHRGIGLYYLALRRAPAESLLFQSAAELVLAQRLRPEEARPCWYLYQVWSKLALSQPAQRWLRAADEAAPFSALAPAERRGLELACLHRSAGERRK